MSTADLNARGSETLLLSRESEGAAVGSKAGHPGTVLAWTRQGALAITDHGLIAGSNFVLGIVLARWLRAEQYGAYALAYAIFLLLTAFHQALLLEPLAVLGPSLYAGSRKQYLGKLLWLHAIIGLAIMTVLGLCASVAGLTGHADLAEALWGLTLGAPWILLLWLARNACYVELAPARSAAGAILYCALVLGGIWLVYRNALVSPFAVFVLMGVGGLASGAVLLARLGPAWRPGSGGPALSEVWREHWGYGRWAAGSLVVNWIPGNIFYAVTGILLGMRDAGAFRALMNISLPVVHTGSAISILFLPYLSRDYGHGGPLVTRKGVERVTLLYAAGAVGYGLLFCLAGKSIFHLLYGGKFMEWEYLAPWVIVGVVFQVSSYGPCVGLRATQAPDAVFRAYCAAAAISLAVGIPATWVFRLPGAVAATALSTLAGLLVAAWLYRRKLAHAARRRSAA